MLLRNTNIGENYFLAFLQFCVSQDTDHFQSGKMIREGMQGLSKVYMGNTVFLNLGDGYNNVCVYIYMQLHTYTYVFEILCNKKV